MQEILCNPMFQGIAAIIAIISLLLTIYIERKKIFPNWNTTKKLPEKIKIVPPKRPLSFPVSFLFGVFAACIIFMVIGLIISVTSADKVGKPIVDTPSFSIGRDYYQASGKMGDIGDIYIIKDADVDRFSYEIQGRGPHEWDWKYKDNLLNTEPAQFAGVIYLAPPNNWAEKPGFDLRGNCRVLQWEARSIAGPVIVDFIIGGVDWVWDENECKKVTVPYPDSIPRTIVGRATLTEKWQVFSYDLNRISKDSFRNVIGGFAWIIEWGSNGLRLNKDNTGPIQPKTFTIEIRNICYKK